MHKEATVHSIEGKAMAKIALPVQFHEEYRPDLIKRAVLALRTHKMHPNAPNPDAGNLNPSYLSKRRREYKSTYGRGQSRTPRKVMSHHGEHFAYKGAQAPQTVGGRIAHPPKIEKIWAEKINDKERKKAIRSAISASIITDVVNNRGHKVKAELPIIIEEKIEEIAKASQVSKMLEHIGLGHEVERAKETKVRPGRGTMRGRTYKSKVGPLFVVSKNCKLIDSAKNIAGADAVLVKNINAELLAPGTHPGRIVIWSKAAIEELGSKRMFM